jgi:hypothetical protein
VVDVVVTEEMMTVVDAAENAVEIVIVADAVETETVADVDLNAAVVVAANVSSVEVAEVANTVVVDVPAAMSQWARAVRKVWHAYLLI